MSLLLTGALSGGSLLANLIGSGLSASAAKEARDKELKNIRNQQRENQNWYDRRYNEDPTQRADAQRLLTRTAELIKQRNKAAEGKAAVMGASEESVAATKEANAKTIADVASNIAAAGDARKDAIEAQYRATRMGLQNAETGVEAGYDKARSQAIADATKGVSSAFGSVASGLSELEGAAGANGLMTDEELKKLYEKSTTGGLGFTPSYLK